MGKFLKKHKRIIINLLFVVYMIIILRFTVFRSGFSVSNFMKKGVLNLSFFKAYAPYVRRGLWWKFTYFFAGNIVCFIPYGAYLRYRGFRLLPCALLGFALSLFIEAMQYVWGSGVSELDDLILNTVGVFIGACVYAVIVRCGKKKR